MYDVYDAMASSPWLRSVSLQQGSVANLGWLLSRAFKYSAPKPYAGLRSRVGDFWVWWLKALGISFRGWRLWAFCMAQIWAIWAFDNPPQPLNPEPLNPLTP